METTYNFSAHDTESIYGFGTESEASLYLIWLNKDREINLYEMAVSGLTDEQADALDIDLLIDLLTADSAASPWL